MSSWTPFADTFGGFVPGSYLARAVYGYFMNGGGNCYVVRIGQNGTEQQSQSAKELPAGPHAQLGRLRFTAIEAGTVAGEISVEITAAGGEDPSEDMFRVVVKRNGEPVEEYDRVTAGRGRPTSRPWSTPRRRSCGSRRSPASPSASRRPASSPSPR